MNPIRRVWLNIKQAAMRWSGAQGRSWWNWGGPSGTRYDYGSAVGDGRGSTIVMACVNWASRTFPEAPLEVLTRDAEGDLTPAPEHALQGLLERPNPFYSSHLLWSATLADRMLTGNAYWRKVRSGAGRVVELWWIPSSMLEPRWSSGTEFVGWYDYAVDGRVERVDARDVVHFRDGFDPRNVRKGISPLASLLREIATDDEAANFTAAVLRNLGVPGVVLAPESGPASQAEAEMVKQSFMARFGGEHRGEPLVMKGPTKVSVLSFSPEQMQLRDLRKIPEERITAIFGTPAIVVGLGAGLDRSTFSNFAEAREAAYESMIIPIQRFLAADLQLQLVPDFGDPARLRLRFDLSQVRVLQQDENALYERAGFALIRGLLTRNQALQLIGEEPEDGSDVLYVPNTVTPTPLDTLIPPKPAALPPAPPPGDQGGQGPAAPPAQGEGGAQPAAAGRPRPGTKGDRPLPVPAEVDITDGDVGHALQLWDAAFPEMAGLLDAAVEGGRNGHG